MIALAAPRLHAALVLPPAVFFRPSLLPANARLPAPRPAAHTLGNALRDVMWSHPHVQLASYTQEHPSSQEILLRCQTSGAISAEQGVAEALQMMQQMLAHMGQTMEGAVAQWQAQHPEGQQQQQAGQQAGQQRGKQRQQQQQQGGGDAGTEDEEEDEKGDAMEEDS